jgi:murein DD-endopeptidase MepM/ murein hydrolase activator NlpD
VTSTRPLNPAASRLRALRRLAGRRLRSEEIRWRLLILTSRYISHVAIVCVALAAAALAGAHLTTQRVSSANGASAPGPTAGGESGATGSDAALDPEQAGAASPGSGSKRYTPQVFENYVTLNNQDGGLLTRRAVAETASSVTTRLEIITYTVKAGDTLEAIAARFGLRPTTLMWSNEDSEDAPDRLAIGQVLNVLPVDGIWYTVQEDDTLDGIAAEFKAKTEDIVNFPLNNLADGANIAAGQKLVVPNGVKPIVVQVAEAQAGGYAGGAYTGPAVGAGGNGAFLWPTTGYRSQGYWWGHPAIDIASGIGVPIMASDGGYVSFAGWDSTGYGYMVMVNHGNGFSTVYAHLSRYYVDPGQPVARGQVIAEMGSTGRSTGPHLHFEIRYGGVPQNPLYYLP